MLNDEILNLNNFSNKHIAMSIWISGENRWKLYRKTFLIWMHVRVRIFFEV